MDTLTLTKKDVAEQLQISERTVDYLRSSGKLISIKIGNSVRFLQEDITAFLYQQRVVPVAVQKENPYAGT